MVTRFEDFASLHGLDIRDLRLDGKIHRCPTETHPRSRNGAYACDGERGWVQNWETGEPVAWWNDPAAKPWTEADRRAWAERRRAAEEETRRGHALAANKAGILIAAATPDEHPYLRFKGFPGVKGLVAPGGELIVPMRDAQNNALLGCQTLALIDSERWEKKMIYGMRAKGAVFRIGPQRAAETVFVEGYATGLSVDAAIRMLRLSAAVVVCFSASNLQHVASLTTGRRFVFADNDASQTGEKAALATGLPYCMSDAVGEDANDLHQRAGIMAVASKLMALRRAA